MTKKEFIEQAVLAAISSGKWTGSPDGMWEWADSIWEANPNKGSERGRVKATRFTPPSVLEVAAYIKEKGYRQFTAQKFCNFYEAKGWMVGKNKMKDWKASVRTWGEKEKTDSSGKPTQIGFV